VAVLDNASHRLRYTNAGHNPGLLLRHDGETERLPATGIPLGILPGAEYGLEERTLDVGDTLVLYTDGITEACDPDGEEYGLERLQQVGRSHAQADLEELEDAIERDVAQFARGVPFADDRTLVLLRRLD